LDASIARAGIASASAATIRQSLQASAVDPHTGQSAEQIAGEYYEDCIYRQRLNELEAQAATPSPEPSIFAQLPRRGGADGAAAISDSLNAGSRDQRQQQALADRGIARQQEWHSFMQGVGVAAQTYAQVEQQNAQAAAQAHAVEQAQVAQANATLQA